MTERPNPESFEEMAVSQNVWESAGVYFFPIPKEHTEGLVTRPLIRKIRDKVRQRGFSRVAGHTAITFSGYREDPREVHQIPEVRKYWRKLDAEVEELPALLMYLPEANFNGPVQHMSLIGEIDLVIDHPEQRRHDLYVLGADRIIKQATDRIVRSGLKYHLRHNEVMELVERFIQATTFPQLGQ